ncbi:MULTISPECIES: DUF1801 domain-containing protein [Halocynthiibacter]|uniref:DUF1801 domain-containing protein n=1 Tax=Halocynthiibacter halioticoli TaxID=2986804 RepID=A0AAE3LSJ8_9RHOB|nr:MULTISPECIES: DUF1801 domain-containing protein [Halocynthiibacter]MCV6823541.1 DUF1801 domain-containing protein [Halocynthiibacter halioticoli]MCW4056542.1 DUF1801 domain-containing protein [Halocynthiibacter sp. SDUM655004]
MANKTQPTEQDVHAYLAAIEHEGKRADALKLNDIFKRVTGYNPVMWGEAIVGYGQYHYRYESGREGDFLATGFAPRKANFSVYIMPGYSDFGDILARLGKHKLGKACLYFNKLSDIDTDVLEELIGAGLRDLEGHWPVKPT